jgi:hypothetical protein
LSGSLAPKKRQKRKGSISFNSKILQENVVERREASPAKTKKATLFYLDFGDIQQCIALGKLSVKDCLLKRRLNLS